MEVNQPGSLGQGEVRTLELRALSLLVFAATLTPFALGKMSPALLALSWGLLFPIWFDLPFDKVRDHFLWKWFTMFSFGLFILSRVIKTSWFHSIIILILFSVVYEVYGERRKTAHIRILSLLSFFILIAQFRFDQGINLFGGILLFFFCMGVTLMRFRQIRLAETLGREWLNWKKILLPMTALFLILFPFCLLLFWIIPRSENSSLQAFALRNGNFISAFSDQVSLNDIGTISQSRRHVFDLIPHDGESVPSSYIVGRVLDRFLGGIWSSTTRRNKRLRSPGEKGIVHIQKDIGLSESGSFPRFEVSIRPLKGNPMFFFPEVVGIEIVDPIYVETEKKHIYHPSKFPLLLHYTLVCAPERYSSPLTLESKEKSLSLMENQAYFQKKAQSIFGPGMMEMGSREKIRILRQFFSDQFLYTLEINNFGQRDPLLYFLEDTHQGHCELFASSAALILRGAGVPTRLVTGFLLPEMINDDFYHVTEASAHAWVEVWVEDHWQVFDPTGSVGLAALSWSRQKMAILNRGWEDFIVMWDASTQKEWFQAVRNMVNNLTISRTRAFIICLILLFLTCWRYRPLIRNWMVRPSALSHFEKIVFRTFPHKPVELPWDLYVHQLKAEPQVKSKLKHWLDSYFLYSYGNLPENKKQSAKKKLMSELKTVKKSIQGMEHHTKRTV